MAQGGQLYFAYGANINRAVLAKRGVKPLDISPAKLLDPSLALCFQHRGGFGTLKAAQCPSDCEQPCCIHGPVHGTAMQIDAAGWTALRGFETGYRVQHIELETYGPSCRLLKALAFVSQRQLMLRRPVAPPARYLKLLREGAACWSATGACDGCMTRAKQQCWSQPQSECPATMASGSPSCLLLASTLHAAGLFPAASPPGASTDCAVESYLERCNA